MSRNLARSLTVVAAAGIVVLLAAAPAAAAPAPPPAVNDLSTIIDNIRFWIVGILGGVATLFLCIGGARLMMAGDDPSEVERAKSSLKNAGRGYAAALLAPVIPSILNSILLK